MDIQFFGKFGILLNDGVINIFRIIHQVHLVDGDHQMRNPQEGDKKSMTFGLCKHPVAGVDQNDGAVGG